MNTPQIIVLITGANQGVGYETAKNLIISSASYHIILGSRDPSKGENAILKLKNIDTKGTFETIQLDVTSTESITAATHYVAKTYGRLDILINNAGRLSAAKGPGEALRENFEANTLGAVTTTELFLPLLRKSHTPKLIFLTSSLGSLTHASDSSSPYYQSSGGVPGVQWYRASKVALDMAMLEYHKMLKDEGFMVWGVDPGVNRTGLVREVASGAKLDEMAKRLGIPEPEVGAQVVAEVVKGLRNEDVGKVVGKYGVRLW